MNDHISDKNQKLFQLFLEELARTRKEHNYTIEELSESLLLSSDELELLIKGDISLFTAAIWLRAVSQLGIDTNLLSFISSI